MGERDGQFVISLKSISWLALMRASECGCVCVDMAECVGVFCVEEEAARGVERLGNSKMETSWKK